MSEEDKRRAWLARRIGMAADHSLTSRNLQPASENELVELAHRLKDYGINARTVATLAIRRQGR